MDAVFFITQTMIQPLLDNISEDQSEALGRLDPFIQKTIRRFPKSIGEFDLKGRQPRLKPLEFDLMKVFANLEAEGRKPSVESAFQTFAYYFNLFFDEKMIAYLDSEGKNHLLRLAIECALCPEVLSEIQFRVGVGANDKLDLSARVPAYLLPIVRLLSQVQGPFKPQVVVYSAVNRVVPLNRLDPSQSQINNDRIFAIFERFLQGQTANEARQGVRFQPQDAYDPDSELEKELGAITDEILATRADLPVVQKILTTGQRNGSDPRQGLLYGVSHAVYSLDPLSITNATFFPGETPPSRLVMVGGAAEVDYWRIRQLVCRRETTLCRVQIIQPYCEVSPYGGVLRDQDLSVEQVMGMDNDVQLAQALESLRSSFRKDLNALGALSQEPLQYLQNLLR